jgi:hypothetical protein
MVEINNISNDPDNTDTQINVLMVDHWLSVLNFLSS